MNDEVEDLGFDYVVTKKDPPKLCFGSVINRETLPRKGPNVSPFMRKVQGEGTCDTLGPGTHDDPRTAFYDLMQRKTSAKYHCSQSPRFKDRKEYQPPPQPPAPEKPVKQFCAPFNSTSRRKGFFTVKPYPSACDYMPIYKKKCIKFSYSFGGKKVMRCPVKIKCVPYNLDECAVCGCSCSAQGDYWQYGDRISLCRHDYDELCTNHLAKYKDIKLTDFKAVRDCFFAHFHNSCAASVKIMSIEEILKKLRKEAYLDLFFPLQRYCVD